MQTYEQFFGALGQRVREVRKRRDLSQEDMIGLGFSARHWQQIERGRPITLTTLLRISDALKVSPEFLISRLHQQEAKRG